MNVTVRPNAVPMPSLSLDAKLMLQQLKKSFSPELVGSKKRHLSQYSLCVNDSQLGKTFAETYRREEVIGEGGFAMVYRCQHKKNMNHYAVKKIHMEDYNDSTSSLKHEIRALRHLSNCAYVIRLFDIFREMEHTYLIMEELKGGNLLEKLGEKKVYSPADSKTVTRRLLEAIRFCHKKRIAHRDIKPENIVLVSAEDDMRIKLCDFGCARMITKSYCFTTMAGSPQYAAPEDNQCDLWSLGVVVFVLLGGYCPFDGNPREIARDITEGAWSFDDQSFRKVPRDAKNLIEGLLMVDPAVRLTADQALDSSWVRRRELDRMTSMSVNNGAQTVAHKTIIDGTCAISKAVLPAAILDEKTAAPVPPEDTISACRLPGNDGANVPPRLKNLDASDHTEVTEFTESTSADFDSWHESSTSGTWAEITESRDAVVKNAEAASLRAPIIAEAIQEESKSDVEDNDDAEDTLPAKIEDSSVAEAGVDQESADVRMVRAFFLWGKYGQPNKTRYRERLLENPHILVKADDVELLPWNFNETVLNATKVVRVVQRLHEDGIKIDKNDVV